MWASNKLEVPVLGNLLMPCNVLVLFRRGKKRFAPGVTGTSVTGWPLSRLLVTPAEVYDTFSRGWVGKVQKNHVAYHFFHLEIFNCSFSFIPCRWFRFVHSTSLQPMASQPCSRGEATNESKMDHRASFWEPMLLIERSPFTLHEQLGAMASASQKNLGPVWGNPSDGIKCASSQPSREKGARVVDKVGEHIHWNGN